MNKAALKAAIPEAMSAEAGQSLDKQQNISNGYEHENELMKVAQKAKKIILEKSLVLKGLN